MKGKNTYRISKVDTKLYVKGLSGILVYKALYAILLGFGMFTVFYLLTSPLLAIIITVPPLMLVLYRIHKIQHTLGADGYQKMKMAKKLPHFISVRQKLIHTLTNRVQ